MSENNICRTTLVAALVANLQEAKSLLVMDSLGTKLLSISNSIIAPKLPASRILCYYSIGRMSLRDTASAL